MLSSMKKQSPEHIAARASSRRATADAKWSAVDWRAVQEAYNSGLTLRQCTEKFGIGTTAFAWAKDRKLFQSRNLSAASKISNIPRKPHSLKTKNVLSERMTERIRRNVRYSKQQIYNGVVLDSEWEIKLAKSLDAAGIRWQRPKALIWFDGEQKRRYLPDFYLPDFDIYLEPKNGYLQKRDRHKLESASFQNSVRIAVLGEQFCDWDKLKNRLESILRLAFLN